MSTPSGITQVYKGIPSIIERLRYSYEDEADELDMTKATTKAVSMPLDRLVVRN